MFIYAKRFFDGDSWYDEVAIEIDETTRNVLNISEHKYQEDGSIPLVIPALIDLQLYGASGRLLSEMPDIQTISEISKYCSKGGVYYFQPTIASQSNEVIYNAIDAVREYISKSAK